MILKSLKPLYQSIISQEIQKYKFPFNFKNTVFDVFFLAETTPYGLLFGAQGKNFSMSFDVDRGFRVNPVLDGEVFL